MSERPTIREATGVALNTKHMETSYIRRTASDFIAALGGAPELGSCLWRVKYGGEEHLLHHTYTLLVKHVWRGAGKPRKHIEQICKMALEEWSIDMCVACNGQGHVGRRERAENKKVPCGECSGKGSQKRRLKSGPGFMNHTCKRCCGNGHIFETVKIPGEKHRVCQVCNGSKSYVRTDSERAAWMKLPGCSEMIQVGTKVVGGKTVPAYMRFAMTPEEQFTTYWFPKFQKVLDELRRLDRKTDNAVKDGLS